MPTQPTVQTEAPEELARLRDDLIAFYRPVNSQERLAAERIALAQQSMLRAARLETSLFADPPGKELHSVLGTKAFELFLRYQAQAERAYRRAIEEIMLLQSQRPLRPAVPKPAAPPLKPEMAAPPARTAAACAGGNPALRL